MEFADHSVDKDPVSLAREEYEKRWSELEAANAPPIEDAESALKRAFPYAIETMLHIMRHEINHPATRLKAAEYIANRYLGPITTTKDQQFNDLIKSLQSDK